MKTQSILFTSILLIIFIGCSKEIPFEDLTIEQQLEGTWMLDSLTYKGEAEHYSTAYQHVVSIEGEVIEPDYQLVIDSETGVYNFSGEYLINIKVINLSWVLGQTGLNGDTENKNYRLSELEDSDSFSISEENRIEGLRVSNGKDPYLDGINYTIETLTEEELVLTLYGIRLVPLGQFEAFYTTTGKIKFIREKE